MQFDCLIEEERWNKVRLRELAETAAIATLTHLRIDPEICELSALACDDARISVLNRSFRGKSGPTNVLSWPTEDLSPQSPGESPLPPQQEDDGALELGDIAIAYETCLREAERNGKSLQDHVSHLMVHGVLHLLGYDHVRDQDATLMEALEIEILGKMGLNNPY